MKTVFAKTLRIIRKEKGMSKIYCSTGAIISLKNNRNYKLIEEYASKIDCDGFEFLMYDSWYENWEQIAQYLAGKKTDFPVFHIEKQVGELISRNEEGDIEQAHKLFEINCKMAKIIGSKRLVLHLWGGLPSDRNISVNIEQFAGLQKTAKTYGLLLMVENVPCNHENPLAHLERLQKAYPDITFTFDTKFAQFHSELDAAFEEEYQWLWKGAVQHVHINDYAGEHKEWKKLRSLHPGEGRIDFKAFFSRLEEVNYEGTFTIESSSVHDNGGIYLEKLNESLRYLREHIRR